ncbi:hypothetical protein LX32DRAFT_254878 [Colletotrichum zoysiae]|uniref:Uncharacterized protein n=1 Tax=Colletotrichum zoysiae TaxID=1216348 RepID=A0AAD9HTU3_9PEZI|nr:hypothetical protein LX32DRAFT_254878 [Colletotrichum zoysiae]
MTLKYTLVLILEAISHVLVVATGAYLRAHGKGFLYYPKRLTLYRDMILCGFCISLR